MSDSLIRSLAIRSFTMLDLIQQAADLLSDAHSLVVLTGAGVSKESGIPTFREAQEGLWARYDPERLATMAGFLADPTLVWRWYQYRLDLAGRCQPNPGHQAIAALEAHVPDVHVITQNIDGLHQQAGSSHVLELHGSIRRFKCLRGHLNLTLAELQAQEEVPPRCPRSGCGALVRPDVIWFGETLNESVLQQAFARSQACDVMLIVGTSGIVTPAAWLPSQASQSGARIVEVNPAPSALTHLADIHLAGPAGEVLPQVVGQMGVMHQT